jgi:CheY-like chemotaxis protein
MIQKSNGHLASVEAADGIRVVLAGSDRRLLRVTSFLLGRKGFLIDSVRTTDELVQVVERQRPDVVILDGSDSLAGTTRAIAAIEALSYPVAVLVVAEAPDVSSPRSLRLLHKWTSFDRLVDEVERLWADTHGQEVSHELA